jgi:hypothetical protein
LVSVLLRAPLLAPSDRTASGNCAGGYNRASNFPNLLGFSEARGYWCLKKRLSQKSETASFIRIPDGELLSPKQVKIVMQTASIINYSWLSNGKTLRRTLLEDGAASIKNSKKITL